MRKTETVDSGSSDWQVYRRLLSYLMPHLGIFALAIVALVLYALADAAMAYILEPLLDEGLTDRSAVIILVLPLVIVGLFIVRGASGFVSSYAMSYVGQKIIATMRNEVFSKYLLLNNRYYDNHSSGEMLSRLIFTVEQVANSITGVLSKAFREILTMIFLICLMVYLSPMLAGIILLAGPVVVLVVRYISRRFRKLAKRIQNSVADISRAAEQSIFGQKMIKMFGAHAFETQRFEAANEHSRRSRMKEALTLSAASPVIQVIVSFALAAVIYIALSDPEMSAGTFGAFMVAAGRLLQPLRNIPGLLSKLQKGIAAADDIFVILDTADETDSEKPDLAITNGKVSISNLSFAYDQEKGDVLHNVDLNINGGEMVALVGQSGSGKSTIAALLPRLYDWEHGQITIDGQDTQAINLTSLRSAIALVSQEVVLFDDTVAANIAYPGDAEYTEEQIIAAAKAANAWDFIEALPQGLDTMVGERGVMLSGGQRQRLSIARAILKDAPILILDEATAALDTESERKIQTALEKLMEGRTTLVIAHRLSTIEKADRIVVMGNGKILEAGSHSELMANNAQYANLHNLQFSDS